MNTITFKDRKKQFVITVKNSFLNICPYPNKFDIEDLVVKYNFRKYLHNPYGLAILYTNKIPKEVKNVLKKRKNISKNENMLGSYWLNGKLISKSNWKKLQNKYL